MRVMSYFDNISVILVNPHGSMNIGMAARAMKNCGITRLKLVDPIKFKPNDTYMMAVGAKDIVDSALHFKNLTDALKNETCSAAFSRRMTKDRIPYYSLSEITSTLIKRAKKGTLALVFGSEADGLTREDLYQCDFRVYIPTSESFGSLNLAQAVILACYELFKKRGQADFCSGRACSADHDKASFTATFFVDQKTIKPMLNDLEKLLSEIGYDSKHEGKLCKKIIQAFKEICGRAGLRKKDVNMFLGIFSQVRKNIDL